MRCAQGIIDGLSRAEMLKEKYSRDENLAKEVSILAKEARNGKRLAVTGLIIGLLGLGMAIWGIVRQ